MYPLRATLIRDQSQETLEVRRRPNYARLIRWIISKPSVRWPAIKYRRSDKLQVESELACPARRVLKLHVVSMYEDQYILCFRFIYRLSYSLQEQVRTSRSLDRASRLADDGTTTIYVA